MVAAVKCNEGLEYGALEKRVVAIDKVVSTYVIVVSGQK